MDTILKQYFSILGFAEPVSTDQVKQRYRKLVIQHHPDKGGNPEIFKQIQEAYEYILGQGKEVTVQPIQGKCSDIHLTMAMTLKDFYQGKKCNTTITHDKICPICRGQGYQQEHPQNTKCTYCQKRNQSNCNLCLGTGMMITQENMCPECKGIRVIKARKTLELQFPQGLKNGEQLTIANIGNEHPGKTRGRVYLKVTEAKPSVPQGYPSYFRKGNDLYLTQRINLTDALAGHQFKLKLLDDREIMIRTTGVIIPGQSKRIPGYGMPIRNRPRKRGHLIIKFEVYFPAQLITPKSELQRLLKQPGSDLENPTPITTPVVKI